MRCLEYVDRSRFLSILKMYKNKKHVRLFNDKDCAECPALFWVDLGLSWCIVEDVVKAYNETPTCTEYDWDKFVLEHV